MQIKGKVVQVLAPQKINTKKGEITKQAIIFTPNPDDNYSDQLLIESIKWAFAGVQAGEELTIEYNSRVTEYNGRHFMNLSAWKVEREKWLPDNEEVDDWLPFK